MSLRNHLSKKIKSTLFNEYGTKQSSTDEPSAPSNWNLEMLIFEEGGKPENPGKNPRSKGESQQQTQPTYDAGSGIEPGTHGWEGSSLTTVPPLLP